jgi:hypothetical protein
LARPSPKPCKRGRSSAEEVVATYEATKAGGKRFRNTKILTFEG